MWNPFRELPFPFAHIIGKQLNDYSAADDARSPQPYVEGWRDYAPIHALELRIASPGGPCYQCHRGTQYHPAYGRMPEYNSCSECHTFSVNNYKPGELPEGEIGYWRHYAHARWMDEYQEVRSTVKSKSSRRRNKHKVLRRY